MSDELTNETITITLDLKYSGDRKALAEALNALSKRPMETDESGAIPSTVWRILNAALGNEGDLLVAHRPSNLRRYKVDITYTLHTHLPELVENGLINWKNAAHGQMCDELMNLSLVNSIWRHHTYSKVNIDLITEITEIRFSQRYGGGSGDSTRFTVKVSHIFETQGNDKAEAIDYNEIYRAMLTWSKNNENWQAAEGAMVAEIDCLLDSTCNVELITVEEL